MKLLTGTIDAISIQLDDGRVVVVKEQEFVILGDKKMGKCKVGYDDAIIMSLALKTIFADVFKELKELRKKNQRFTKYISAL